jgi:diacylglycerol kinase family enzyme
MSAGQRVLVVLNPVAGTTEAGSLKQMIRDHLHERGWQLELHETQPEERITEFVRSSRLEDYALVIAAGGDGTVSAVAGALVGSSVPLGIVPAGTGNALARDLGISSKPAEALQQITAEHEIQAIDALDIGEFTCFLNASAGVSAATMFGTERQSKQRLGIVAYLTAGIKKLTGIQPAKFTLAVDGVSQTMRAADVVIAHSGRLGDTPLQLVPDVRLGDGQVIVCAIQARSAWSYVGNLVGQILRLPKRDGPLRCWRAEREVSIETDRSLPTQSDGEPLGHGGFSARMIPQAVGVIVPLTTDESQAKQLMPLGK